MCPRGNLKTIADTCFLLGSYVDWKKYRMSSHVKVIAEDQGHFSESSRGIRLPISSRGSDVPSPMSSFSSVILSLFG